MSFDYLPIEIVYHVLRAYGQSPEAFCRRWATRRVCRLFYESVPHIAEKIRLADWVMQNIHVHLQKHSPCKAYDIDDSMFVRIPGEQPGCRGLLSKVKGMMGTRILYHPFSEKFVLSRFNMFWRSDSLERVSTMPDKLIQHVKPPSYVTQESKASRLKQNKIFEDRSAIGDAMTTMIKSLNLHHSSVTKISCKETSLTKEGFDALGALLQKNANIGKLNISCHMNDGSSDQIISVLNVASLIHLNISFCGCISMNEVSALIGLMKNNKLTTLKTIGTEILWFEYFVAALTLSSVVELTYSLPRDCCITASYICHIHEFKSLKVYDDVNMWSESKDELGLLKHFGKKWAYSTGCRARTNDFNEEYFSTFLYATQQDCAFLVDTFMKMMNDAYERADDEFPKVTLKLKQPSFEQPSSWKHPIIMKNKRREMYDKRNKRRNELISTSKTCKCCNTVWPRGSIKLQTFEGLQSMCHLGKRSCSLSMHYRTVFG